MVQELMKRSFDNTTEPTHTKNAPFNVELIVKLLLVREFLSIDVKYLIRSVDRLLKRSDGFPCL